MSKLVQLLALLSLALCACVKEVQATQVLVIVESELGSEVSSYEVRVSDQSETVADGPRSTIITQSSEFSFALVPAAKSPADENLIIISALDASGNVIAVNKTLVTFRDRATVQVTVRLSQACRGRICDPQFTCTSSGAGTGECVPVEATDGEAIEPITKPRSELMGGTSEEVDGGGRGAGAVPGMAGGADGPDGAAGGGNPAGASPTGGTAAGGMTAGGTMGGALDAGDGDAGPITMAECDTARPCTLGYSCMAGLCISLCAQTTCDANATCTVNASGAPVCTCNSGYLSMTGAGGAVTCMKTQMCTDLRCDANATCEAPTGQQPRCACRPGYTGTGMTCAPISCGALSIANGTVQTNGGTFGQMAEYTCDPGYVKTGGTARRCEVAGWSGTAPTCQPRDCGTPAAPSFGRVTVTNGTRYPTGTVRYTCNSGFQLSGSNSDTRTCTASGAWSGAAPTCIGCGDGIVSQSLFEDCEPNSLNTWSCITCKNSTAYQPCGADGACPNGYQCHSAGYCTVAPCSSDAQCPRTPASSPVRASCEGGGFACSLTGCTANAHCPPGLRCNTTERFCTLF